MRSDTKNKVLYIIFNALFAIPLLLMSILGMTLINYVLYVIGAIIVLIGIISFFPSIVVKTGIFDEFGNEYVETNLFERLATLGITVLIGGAIAMLPSFLNMPSFFGYVAIVALAVGLGIKITAENSKYYLYPSTVIIGQFVPLAYMIGGAAFLAEAAFSIGIWFRILVMSLAFVLHCVRAVLVFRQSAFYLWGGVEMRNIKINHLIFHVLVVLATVALASSLLFATDHSDENLYYAYEVASGIAYLVAGTLIAGSFMFFKVEKYWEDDAEFDKTMLIPLIPAMLLAFQASELLASAVYVDAQATFYWTAAIGVVNCFFIPMYKKLSLHAIFKVLSILLYLSTFLTVWLEGPWFTLAVAFAGVFSLFSLIFSYGASENY